MHLTAMMLQSMMPSDSWAPGWTLETSFSSISGRPRLSRQSSSEHGKKSLAILEVIYQVEQGRKGSTLAPRAVYSSRKHHNKGRR